MLGACSNESDTLVVSVLPYSLCHMPRPRPGSIKESTQLGYRVAHPPSVNSSRYGVPSARDCLLVAYHIAIYQVLLTSSNCQQSDEGRRQCNLLSVGMNNGQCNWSEQVCRSACAGYISWSCRCRSSCCCRNCCCDSCASLRLSYWRCSCSCNCNCPCCSSCYKICTSLCCC
jgi:hypothetical protein